MCGIVGYVGLHNTFQGSLDKSLDVISHRGPDGSGVWMSPDGRIAFGHRRLAIIDTIALSNQPMKSAMTENVIVFNGEIYNYRELRKDFEFEGYRFKTHSDTEVILASYEKWGEDCLSRFNGMFSFVLYDASRRKIFCARDRSGEKPFFYTLVNGDFYFASELKALLAFDHLDKKIDIKALDNYFALGFVPGDNCILSGFHKLHASHSLSLGLDNGQLSVKRYWEEPMVVEGLTNSTSRPEELLDEFEMLLNDAVKRQMVADVPIGVLLSGGVDSSLITAFAARQKTNLKTFTVSFPGEKKYDESRFAKLVANAFGTHHLELTAEPATYQILPKLAWQFDEPINDSSMIPTFILSKLVRKYCTVALGGDGADELFGGYRHYNKLFLLEKYTSLFPRVIGKAVSKSSIILSDANGIKPYLFSLKDDFNCSTPLVPTYFSARSRKKMLKCKVAMGSYAEKTFENEIRECDVFMERNLRHDFRNYLCQDILVKSDRASMLNSLELRSPFLDYKLIEFAFGKIPYILKVNEKERKILLKKLAQRVLPKDFDSSRKQGFSIPMRSWLMGGDFRKFFQDVLFDASSIYDPVFVRHLFDQQDKGGQHGERLFGMLIFELWMKQHSVRLN